MNGTQAAERAGSPSQPDVLITAITRRWWPWQASTGDVRLIRLLGASDPRLQPLFGLDFAQIGTRLGTSPVDAQLRIARQTRLGATVAVGAFSGDATVPGPLDLLIAHPSAAVVSNAALTPAGEPNPAAYGAFARLLGYYSRERKLLSIQEAMRRAPHCPPTGSGLQASGASPRATEPTWSSSTPTPSATPTGLSPAPGTNRHQHRPDRREDHRRPRADPGPATGNRADSRS